MKAVVAAFNQEKALEGAFSVITNLRMELFEALILTVHPSAVRRNCLHRSSQLKVKVNGWFPPVHCTTGAGDRVQLSLIASKKHLDNLRRDRKFLLN